MTDNLTPREVYRFEYTHEDAIMALRRQRKPNARAFVVSVVVALLFYFIYISKPYAIPLALAVLVFVALPQLIVLSRHKKAWEKTYNRLRETAIDYKIFDDHLIMLLYRRGEIMGTSKVYLCDISKVQTEGEYVIITIGNQFYTLRRCDVPGTSILFRPLHLIPAPAAYVPPETTAPAPAPMPTPEELPGQEDITPTPSPTPIPVPPPLPASKPINSKLNAFSWILFIGSFIALIIAGNLSTWYELYILLPVCAVWALIPIASLVVGIIMNKQGSSGGKNIIAGIIVSVILVLLILANLAVQSIPFDELEDYTEFTELDNYAFSKAEEFLGVDLPTPNTIVTVEEECITSCTNLHYSGHLNFYFDVDLLENDSLYPILKDNPNWMTHYDLVDISPNQYPGYAVFRHHVLIYNVDTGEYNTLPVENGTYHFIYISYDPVFNSIDIIEYDVVYTK